MTISEVFYETSCLRSTERLMFCFSTHQVRFVNHAKLTPCAGWALIWVKLDLYRCFHDLGLMFDTNYIQSDNRKFWSRLLVGKNSTALYGDVVWRSSCSVGNYQSEKGVYYGTLRCRTVHSKENFQGNDQFCGFCDWFTVPPFPSHQGAWPELPVTALNMICTFSKFHHTSIVKASIEIKLSKN